MARQRTWKLPTILTPSEDKSPSPNEALFKRIERLFAVVGKYSLTWRYRAYIAQLTATHTYSDNASS